VTSLVSAAKTDGTDGDAVWVVNVGGPKEPRIRWDPDPHARGKFQGKGQTTVKYRDSLP